MNEVVLGWKKITKGLPKQINASNDRTPDIEEIKNLIEYPEIRIKPIIYTHASSGIRLGAWDFLRWKHIIPIKQKIISSKAKIIVYAGENENIILFNKMGLLMMNKWMDFRASYGEKITGESWLIRDLWKTTNIDYGAKSGLLKLSTETEEGAESRGHLNAYYGNKE